MSLSTKLQCCYAIAGDDGLFEGVGAEARYQDHMLPSESLQMRWLTMHKIEARQQIGRGLRALMSAQETEPMGTAGPLALARDLLDDGQPFFVLNR